MELGITPALFSVSVAPSVLVRSLQALNKYLRLAVAVVNRNLFAELNILINKTIFSCQ